MESIDKKNVSPLEKLSKRDTIKLRKKHIGYVHLI